VNVVDSSAWLEFFADGVNAEQFSQPLSDLEQLIVPSISVFEVFRVVCRQRDEEQALQAAALMQHGKIVELSSSLALYAAKLSIELKLPMADSIILATARLHEATLWTQDTDFEGIDGVRYFPKR